MANHGGKMFTMPINLMTINQFFGTAFDPSGAEGFIAELAAKESKVAPTSLEDRAIGQIGRELYEAFIHLNSAVNPPEVGWRS